MSEELPAETYSAYRNRLLGASIPATATAVFGATLVWQGALGLNAPERVVNEWFPNLVQLLVPVGLWVFGRGRLRERPEALFLVADVAYTASLVGRQAFPDTAISGTALYVAMKMLVTALLVQVADGMFAIPLTSISEVNALEEEHIRVIDTTEVLSRRGSSLELCRLRQLSQLSSDSEPQRQFVVEVMAGTRHLGLVVDALQGQQDIIIRPLGRSLHSVRGFSGASELADERIALVLDPGALIEEASGSRERGGRVRLYG